MEQQASSKNQIGKPLSLVFTNSSGQVIFSNREFAFLMGDLAIILLAGMSLRDIFIMDNKAEGQLMDTVRKELLVSNFPASYRSSSGDVIQVLSSVVATTVDNDTFLGADIVIHPNSQTDFSAEEAKRITSHADVVEAYVEMEMNTRNQNQPRTFIQSYLVTQFDLLQVMLARISGSASRAAFEKTANNTARAMDLPVFMENGHLNFTKRDIYYQGYRSLLQASVNYAVNVVGKNIVKQEMLLVDKYVGYSTLELISQMDLKIFSAD